MSRIKILALLILLSTISFVANQQAFAEPQWPACQNIAQDGCYRDTDGQFGVPDPNFPKCEPPKTGDKSTCNGLFTKNPPGADSFHVQRKCCKSPQEICDYTIDYNIYSCTDPSYNCLSCANAKLLTCRPVRPGICAHVANGVIEF